MNNEDIAYFKNKLTEELNTLEGELKGMGRKNPDNANDWEAVAEAHDPMQADPNEAADNIESFEENSAILNDLEIRYNNVKGALNRIKDGTYGICEVSGEPIERERLEANPAATTCKTHIEN